jgi:geranylgeranyl diphosphate synthase, type II
MDLVHFFEEKRRLVNTALEKVLGNRNEIPKALFDAMSYAVFGGGKRIRPILTLTSFEVCKGKNLSWILPFACGIELIHTFSLINDDLPCMDNDDWRRGKPSLHKAFDEATAILAAMALFAKAYELFSESKAPSNKKIRAINDISKAIGGSGIVAGQIMDIKDKVTNIRLLNKIQRKKTAEFIAVSIRVGAIIAGANEEIIMRLGQAGTDLGMLFQITDDMLDAQQDKDNQPTFIKIYGLEQTQRIAKNYRQRTIQKFAKLGKRFSPLVQITDWISKRGN